MMKDKCYHIVIVRVPCAQQGALEGLLYEHGCRGLEEYDTTECFRVKAYFDDDEPLESLLKTLKSNPLKPTIEQAESFRLQRTPFQAAGFAPYPLLPDCWILPPDDLQAEPTNPALHGLIIRPGPAFGTGRHETTQIVSQLLDSRLQNTAALLDVGTGSGILALLAKYRGIPQVTAVEISDEGRENAQENFRLNGYEDIQLYASIKEVSATFPLIVANILTPTLIHLQADLAARLEPQGTLIVCGIAEREQEQFRNAYKEWDVQETLTIEGWVGMVLRR